MSIVIPVDVINIILDYADIYCEDCFRNNMRICYLDAYSSIPNFNDWFNVNAAVYCYICVNTYLEEDKYDEFDYEDIGNGLISYDVTTKELEDEKNRLKNEDYVRLRITPRKQLYNILLKL